MKKITMIINDQKFTIELYDTYASESLYDSLPQTIDMSKWGGEYYGTVSPTIPSGKDQKTSFFEKGEVALWPDGNAFCIFFGPTPASTDERPKMASPGIAFGKIQEDCDYFNYLGESIDVELRKKLF